MAYRVTLSFVADVTEDEAWDIAEKLEQAAMRQNYRECNSWPEGIGGSRLLQGTEDDPGPAVPAETVVRKQNAGTPMGFGVDGSQPITLGGENGESR